ncbi:glycosyltransferase family 2 protein [Desulfofustis limnaeus]|uniref:Glycosyl transferase n=1 Tax=Desulfofustis limnaeus TaxID=2740163 RepID=A0ABN6M5X9_9BACT|nr:glycosyltransferase family 2 protein [Desulfofustis limnaeus]BDD87625.1 glycosyl transferase [Desulfofustis limnaeus]
MELLFWISLSGVFYAYLGYPLLLLALTRRAEATIAKPAAERGYAPTVSLIIPVYNGGDVIQQKIANCLALDYPHDRLEVIIVSDGSTDATAALVNQELRPPLRFYELPVRGGKAKALNHGLARASGEVIVFSDVAIRLDRAALQNIVEKFYDPTIGCVSGEDRIAGASGEGLYGRYELFLRHLESRFFSIVGASGSFYAQRRSLCEPFREGAAPDFLSVLHTVEQGFRAISEPSAFGTMTAVRGTADEFNRKVRTLIRGMTALFSKPGLLSLRRYGRFALSLLSHKLMRWLVPFFLLLALGSNLALLDSPFYRLLLALQVVFYLLAAGAAVSYLPLGRTTAGKIALYFTTVNLAILVAWFKYLRGTRQELWSPSRR